MSNAPPILSTCFDRNFNFEIAPAEKAMSIVIITISNIMPATYSRKMIIPEKKLPKEIAISIVEIKIGMVHPADATPYIIP